MDLREQIEAEALAARRAVPLLTDDAVAEALGKAGALCVTRDIEEKVLEANAADVEAARGRLDPGTFDRLKLDYHDVLYMAELLGTMSHTPPLDREVASWPLYLDKRVTERRIPIGVVGANFEARPGVAVDVASQLLKSLNAGILRTGGAALRTVTVL